MYVQSVCEISYSRFAMYAALLVKYRCILAYTLFIMYVMYVLACICMVAVTVCCEIQSYIQYVLAYICIVAVYSSQLVCPLERRLYSAL